jgi:hypothetical protein
MAAGAHCAMVLEEISYSVSDWNLDGLSLASTPDPYLPGKKSLHPLDASLSPSRGLAYLGFTQLAVLHPHTKALEIMDLNVSRSRMHELLELNGAVRPIDIARSIGKKSLYVLDASQNAVIHICGKDVKGAWPVLIPLSRSARIAGNHRSRK